MPRMANGDAIPGSSGMTYRPLLELGEGGMARIVLALASGPGGFNKLVVLKVMRSSQDSTEIRRLLLAEARLSARLNHPNVVQVQEVVHSGEAPYLVMEYLDGRPLSALRNEKALTSSMVMTVISEALVGLHYAHELADFDGSPLSIVHRDVSPHNVFVTFDGVVKVLDFGIAKIRDEAANTETGEVKGKIAYMPPEQLTGEAVDRRADIFAAGALLWEAATGVRMWANVSQVNLMHRLMTGDIPKPSSVAPVDPELERIIVRATAADPTDRYDTALELQQELDGYLNERGMRVPLREVGAVLSEAFKAERDQRARAIKAALRHSSVAPPANPQLASSTSSELRVEAKPRRRGVTIGVLAVVVSLLALGLVLRASSRSAAVAPPVDSAISLSVHALPPEAKVRIDEREYAQSSVTLSLPRDDHAHRIEVYADGFTTDARTVRFDRSLTLEVALHAAEPAAAPARPSASAPVDPDKSASTVASPRRRHLGTPAAKPAPPPTTDDCTPPYFFAHGIKTYKPQCL